MRHFLKLVPWSHLLRYISQMALGYQLDIFWDPGSGIPEGSVFYQTPVLVHMHLRSRQEVNVFILTVYNP